MIKHVYNRFKNIIFFLILRKNYLNNKIQHAAQLNGLLDALLTHLDLMNTICNLVKTNEDWNCLKVSSNEQWKDIHKRK